MMLTHPGCAAGKAKLCCRAVPVNYNSQLIVFTARRKPAMQALYMLQQICPSMHLSVHPSHYGIVSKRENTEGCGLHHWVAQCL